MICEECKEAEAMTNRQHAPNICAGCLRREQNYIFNLTWWLDILQNASTTE